MPVTIFVLVFLSAWTTEWIGTDAIFGAFLAGIATPRSKGTTMDLTHKLEDFVSIALLPLYFASSGLKTHLGLLDSWLTVGFCLLVIAVACVGKIIGCTLAARLSSGFTWRESFAVGSLMNAKGLVELIVLNIGLDAGVIDDRIFAIFVTMALVTTFMTSPIVDFVYPPKYHNPVGGPGALASKRPSRIHNAFGLKGIDDRAPWQCTLFHLRDIDSIAEAAPIALAFRWCTPPGEKLHLVGLKIFTDVERSSNIIAGTQRELVIESDSTLRVFRFFASLAGATETRCRVATVATNSSTVGVEIERVVRADHCNLVILPWRRGDNDCRDQRLTAVSAIEHVRHSTLGIFVGRSLHRNLCPAALSEPPFAGIVVPLATIRSPSERAAFELAVQLHRCLLSEGQSEEGLLLPMTVIHLQCSASVGNSTNGESGAEETRELMHAVKDASADSSSIALQTVKYGDERELRVSLGQWLKANSGARDLVIVGGQASTALPLFTNVRRTTSASSQSHESRVFGPLGEVLYELGGQGGENAPALLVVKGPLEAVNIIPAVC